LERQGFQVVRFLNDQVIEHLEAVGLSIAQTARSRLAVLPDANNAKACIKPLSLQGEGRGEGD
jgi:hypothetical protein